jgi:hypothetical protein
LLRFELNFPGQCWIVIGAVHSGAIEYATPVHYRKLRSWIKM